MRKSFYSFSSDDEHLSLAPREHLQHPPPSYTMDDSYRLSMPRLATQSATSKAVPEYVMRDDERYPTPVEEDPGLHPYTPPFSPATAFSRDTISPSTVSPISRNLTAVTTPGLPLQKLEVEGNRKNRSPRQQCCGVRRRIFIALVVGLALLVIVGIVVGVVVALKIKEASEDTTRLPALTSSGLFIGTNYTNWNSQIAYTNTTSGKVTFRLNSGAANFTAAQTMDLTIVPSISAPMSMVSMLGTDGNIYINLFYIYDSKIILANVSCDPATVPTACTTIYNDAISDGVSFPVYEYSGLAALYLGTRDLGFRVFYHNSDRYITQLSMDGRGMWDHGATVSGKAPSGSSISAAQVGNTSSLTLFYVDDKSKDLYYISYNKTWEAANPVVTSEGSKWSSLTDFSTCWQPSSDTLYAFFTGSDKSIYQVAATNASNSGPLEWSSTSHDLSWVPSDSMRAGIGAVAWGQDQVRFFRLVAGKLAQSAMSNGVWSAKYI